jgi:hypothetical protein
MISEFVSRLLSKSCKAGKFGSDKRTFCSKNSVVSKYRQLGNETHPMSSVYSLSLASLKATFFIENMKAVHASSSVLRFPRGVAWVATMRTSPLRERADYR